MERGRRPCFGRRTQERLSQPPAPKRERLVLDGGADDEGYDADADHASGGQPAGAEAPQFIAVNADDADGSQPPPIVDVDAADGSAAGGSQPPVGAIGDDDEHGSLAAADDDGVAFETGGRFVASARGSKGAVIKGVAGDVTRCIDGGLVRRHVMRAMRAAPAHVRRTGSCVPQLRRGVAACVDDAVAQGHRRLIMPVGKPDISAPYDLCLEAIVDAAKELSEVCVDEVFIYVPQHCGDALARALGGM